MKLFPISCGIIGIVFLSLYVIVEVAEYVSGTPYPDRIRLDLMMVKGLLLLVSYGVFEK